MMAKKVKVLIRSTYINWTVVLIDLDAQVVADRGEVVWLGHVAKSVVLRMNMMYSSFSLTKIIIDYVLAIGNEKEFPHIKYTRFDLEF